MTSPIAPTAGFSAKRLWRTAGIIATPLVAGLAVAPAVAFAAPQQDGDVQRRVFSGWMLDSLCQEGRPDHVNQSCTMPDGSVWTCGPANGGHGGDNYECTREGAAGPAGPIVTAPNIPPVQVG